mgnify:CR=1 FL=1
MKVVLASSSKFRKQLLDKLNISFKCISPDIDEKRLNNEDVKDYVKRLSIEKASKIACSNQKSIIIGSDEVAMVGTKILGKPLTVNNARKQLKFISGKKIIFKTGICVMSISDNKTYLSVANYAIKMKKLNNNQIDNYIKKEDMLNCAGSIRIEGLAIGLVEKTEGGDPTSIIGLPLIKLTNYLEKLNYKVL